MKTTNAPFTPTQLAKRAAFLAWTACRGPVGMGYLQDNPKASEEEVWGNINIRGDYNLTFGHTTRDGTIDLRADYVFGRMMKLAFEIGNDYVVVYPEVFNREYNGCYSVYKTADNLLEAAAASLTTATEAVK